MAVTGAHAEVTIGTQVIKPDDGLTNVTWSRVQDRRTINQGAHTVSTPLGMHATTASFTCDDNDNTHGALLGTKKLQNVTLKPRGAGQTTSISGNASINVTWQINRSVGRIFTVQVTWSGAPTITA